MQQWNLQPDAQSFTAAISTCGAAGHWEEALKLLERAEKDAIPDCTTAFRWVPRFAIATNLSGLSVANALFGRPSTYCVWQEFLSYYEKSRATLQLENKCSSTMQMQSDRSVRRSFKTVRSQPTCPPTAKTRPAASDTRQKKCNNPSASFGYILHLYIYTHTAKGLIASLLGCLHYCWSPFKLLTLWLICWVTANDLFFQDNICWATALGALDSCKQWQEALKLLLRTLAVIFQSCIICRLVSVFSNCCHWVRSGSCFFETDVVEDRSRCRPGEELEHLFRNSVSQGCKLSVFAPDCSFCKHLRVHLLLTWQPRMWFALPRPWVHAPESPDGRLECK